MKIKVTEDPGFQHDGKMYHKDNVYPDFPDDAGRAFCEAGMTEDVNGDVKTGGRNPNKTVVLEVQNTVTGSKGGEL